MNIQPSDILIKREKELTIWISQRLIAINCDLEDGYFRLVKTRYKKHLQARFQNLAILPDIGKSWRFAKINGRFYYDFDRIPDRSPVFYRSKLPAKEKLLELYNESERTSYKSILKDASKALFKEASENISKADIEFYCFHSPVTFPVHKARELATARALCNTIIAWHNNKRFKAHGILKSEDFWQMAAELTSKESLEGLKVDTAGSLRKKVLYEYPAEDLDKQRTHLINGRFGNDNKRIVGKYQVVNPETGEIMRFDIHEAIIFNAWMNPGKANKLKQSGVFLQYQAKCEEYGIDPVDERTVRHHLARFTNRALMSLERDGHDHFTNRYQPYIPQFKPTYVGSLWVADYTGSKLLYKYNKEIWQEGRKITRTTSGSWYILRIIDTATDYIVGWYCVPVGSREKWESLLPALNMALENNNGCAAMEFVTDNGPAFTSIEGSSRLEMLFEKHRCISLGNKQANKAETYIRLMGEAAREFDNWSMSSFNSTHIDNVANPDYMDLKELPWENEALQQIETLVNKWNNSPRPNGMIPAVEFKNRQRHPKLEKVNDKTKRFVFGKHTKQSLERCRGILKVSTGNGENRQFKEFTFNDWFTEAETIDNALYGSKDMDVKVVWDETGADIYTPDGRYVLTVPPTKKAHATEFEASEQSQEALEEHFAAKKRFEKAAKQFADEVAETFSGLSQNNAESIESLIPEISYLLRAKLNNGKAKEAHNKIHESKQNKKVLHDTQDIDVREFY